MENQFKKKIICYVLTQPRPGAVRQGVIFRKNCLKFNRHLFFFKFSQNGHTYSLIPPLPPQYMVLLHLDQNGAGERHSLKDLPEIQRIHWGSKGGWGICEICQVYLKLPIFNRKKIWFGYLNYKPYYIVCLRSSMSLTLD